MSYNLNKVNRNVLITYQEVLAHAPTKQTLDERMINSSIIVAEERFLRPELGSDYYDYLCDSKNLEITSGNRATTQILIGAKPVLQVGDILNALELMTSADDKTFWKKHLWKICAEAVLISALPEGFIQFGSEGTFHNSPPAGLQVTSGQIVPLASSMKWALDKKIQDRLGPLWDSARLFLCSNRGSYPKYASKCVDCNSQTEANNTKNAGIALDMYDDRFDDWRRPDDCC